MTTSCRVSLLILLTIQSLFAFENYQSAYRSALRKKSKGKINEARIDFKESLLFAKKNSEKARVYKNLGDLDVMEKKPDDALGNYLKTIAMQKVPLDLKAQAELSTAQILNKKGETDKAWQLCEKLIKLDEEEFSEQNAGARLVKANILKKKSEMKNAVAEWEHVLKIEDAEDSQFGEALVEIIAWNHSQNKPEEAMKRTRELLELDATEEQIGSALMTNAAIYRKQGDESKEIETYKKILELPEAQPADLGWASSYLGELLYKQKKYKEAETQLKATFRVCKQVDLKLRAFTQLYLGYVYQALNDGKQAYRNFSPIPKWGAQKVPADYVEKANVELTKLKQYAPPQKKKSAPKKKK